MFTGVWLKVEQGGQQSGKIRDSGKSQGFFSGKYQKKIGTLALNPVIFCKKNLIDQFKQALKIVLNVLFMCFI